jgi:hypothetical protein
MLKSLRHPRVVLFMGACLNPGNLAIVTEYLPRNSLYQVMSRIVTCCCHASLNLTRLCVNLTRVCVLQVLREDNAQQLMPWSVKKQMLLDVASGMVYLHSNTPPVSVD